MLCPVIKGRNRIGLIRIYAYTKMMKGIYILITTLNKDTSIKVGKQRIIHFQKGSYAYIGSALNGLEQRIQRHLGNHKKIHWHIDYFLPYTSIGYVFFLETNQKEECRIARVFKKIFTNIPDFGCGDCTCHSHLFFGSLAALKKAAISVRMKSYPLNEFSPKIKSIN